MLIRFGLYKLRRDFTFQVNYCFRKNHLFYNETRLRNFERKVFKSIKSIEKTT